MTSIFSSYILLYSVHKISPEEVEKMSWKNILLGSRKYVLFFILYAMFGWTYEVVLEVFIYKWGYSDRGVLNGPYCPIYGVGALIFIFCVLPMIKDKAYPKKLLYIIPVFVSCMLIATGIELASTYLLELFTGSWPWQTYKDYEINFQGRIALSPSLRFGLGGLIFLYLIQPVFEFIASKIKDKYLTYVSIAIVVLLSTDIIYTLFFK